MRNAAKANVDGVVKSAHGVIAHNPVGISEGTTMRTVLMVAAAVAAFSVASVSSAEGISQILKRPPVQLLACQQKLCPNPRPPVSVQLAEGDWQHMKKPLLAYGDLPCCAVKRPLVA